MESQDSQPLDGPSAQDVSTEESRAASTKAPGPKGQRYLSQLREHVEAAAQEIQRLREENRALNEKVKALQEQGAAQGDGVVLPIAEDQEAFKKRVEHFIETIDRFLEGDKAAGTG